MLSMMPKSEEFKAVITAIRERIAMAKRRGTHYGMIDYRGCIDVTNELIQILEETETEVERGEYVLGYSIAALIQINLAKLAGNADDSAGGVNEAQGYVHALLEKICAKVEYGSSDAEYILLHAIKDAGSKSFNGWDEFAYTLLEPTAQLATVKTVGKLYAFLDIKSTKWDAENDKSYAQLQNNQHLSWHMGFDRLIRFSAIRAVEGETAAEQFIAENLQYDSIRRIAVRLAIDSGDFARAERLCLEKTESSHSDYHWAKEWYTLLFESYEKAGDRAKQANLAEDLLVGKFDTHYYAILKALLIKNGTWEAKYPPLLIALENNLPYHLLMEILAKEKETHRLLNMVQQHPDSVWRYGKLLAADFPQETYAVCIAAIRKQALEATVRSKYKWVCDNIKRLHSYGGEKEAFGLIDELKANYPRRPAMLDELILLGYRLTNSKAKKKN
jgi:hypothetical protein